MRHFFIKEVEEAKGIGSNRYVVEIRNYTLPQKAVTYVFINYLELVDFLKQELGGK